MRAVVEMYCYLYC